MLSASLVIQKRTELSYLRSALCLPQFCLCTFFLLAFHSFGYELQQQQHRILLHSPLVDAGLGGLHCFRKHFVAQFNRQRLVIARKRSWFKFSPDKRASSQANASQHFRLGRNWILMDYTTQVISAAGSSHLVTFTGVERVPSPLCSSSASARPSKHLRCRKYPLLSCNLFPCNLRKAGVYLSRNQQLLFHALSLQAVTTDNDSEGSNSPGPSSAVDYACIFQEEEGAKKSIIHYIQVWYNNARNQNISFSIKEVFDKSKEVFDKAKVKLRNMDAMQVIKRLKSSEWDTYALQWWDNTQPWIKWPFAIFVPWFLLINLIYGRSVSMDLMPLWIIGPVFVGLVIKLSMELSVLCKQWIANSKITTGLLFIYEDAKTGQLPRHTKEAVSSKFEKMRRLLEDKKADIVCYIKSGQIIVSLKHYSEKKFLELWQSSIDKYEDFRLFWLALERKLRNII